MNEFQKALHAFVDPRTPLRAKLLVIAAALYGISPIDFIPDFLPLIGELDDITLIIVAILLFLRISKPVRKSLQ